MFIRSFNLNAMSRQNLNFKYCEKCIKYLSKLDSLRQISGSYSITQIKNEVEGDVDM